MVAEDIFVNIKSCHNNKNKNWSHGDSNSGYKIQSLGCYHYTMEPSKFKN